MRHTSPLSDYVCYVWKAGDGDGRLPIISNFIASLNSVVSPNDHSVSLYTASVLRCNTLAFDRISKPHYEVFITCVTTADALV